MSDKHEPPYTIFCKACGAGPLYDEDELKSHWERWHTGIDPKDLEDPDKIPEIEQPDIEKEHAGSITDWFDASNRHDIKL